MYYLLIGVVVFLFSLDDNNPNKEYWVGKLLTSLIAWPIIVITAYEKKKLGLL